MTAQEFKSKNYSDIHGVLYDNNSKEITWLEFAEAYHKEKINLLFKNSELFKAIKTITNK